MKNSNKQTQQNKKKAQKKPVQVRSPRVYRKKNVINIQPRKGKSQYELGSAQPLYSVVVPTQQSLYQTQVSVVPDWNPLCVQEMLAAMTSYFLTRGIASGEDTILKLQQFYNGILYQFIGMVSEISGQPKLTKRLCIVNDLIKAFQQKSISKFRFQKIAYSWNDISLPTDGKYLTGWNSWDFVTPEPDTSTYDAPSIINPVVPTPEDYSAYLGLVTAISSNRAHFLSEVTEDAISVLANDVSTFSKVYPYVGLNPSKSGSFYNDVENETAITAPILAHNVIYPITAQDNRVPFKLSPNEGGPATNLAPLLPFFDSWFNKVPINYKFIDFFDVVNTLIYWYLEAVQLALKKQPNSVPGDFVLPFSQQDFYIVVRQMLMCSFKDQWIGQFLGPLSYDPGFTNFLPFQILGNCYGNDQFRNLLGPMLMAENLSMLQSVKVVQTNRKSKINNVQYVPIWGYFNDVQPVFSIVNEKTPVPLFATPGQKDISLVDCTISGNIYVNVNSAYYTSVFDTWNDKVTALKEYINVADMSNLSPPRNAAFLQTTRVYGYVPDRYKTDVRSGIVKQLNFPSLRPIQNLNTMEPQLVKTNSKKQLLPSLPRPTDVQFITIDDIYVQFPVSKEVHELMTYLVLPCVRLDPQSANDILNKVMYQTITGEGLSQIQNAVSVAPAYLNRQKNAANMCVEGAGKITSSALTSLMNKLCTEGNGGFLAGLLGGFAKSLIPGADGIIDSIASVVPF